MSMSTRVKYRTSEHQYCLHSKWNRGQDMIIIANVNRSNDHRSEIDKTVYDTISYDNINVFPRSLSRSYGWLSLPTAFQGQRQLPLCTTWVSHFGGHLEVKLKSFLRSIRGQTDDCPLWEWPINWSTTFCIAASMSGVVSSSWTTWISSVITVSSFPSLSTRCRRISFFSTTLNPDRHTSQ